MPKTSDTLHDRIDAGEKLRAEAKQRAIAIWRKRLRLALEAAGEGDAAHAGSRLTEGLQLLAGELATELNEMTADALRQGAKLGRATMQSRQRLGTDYGKRT